MARKSKVTDTDKGWRNIVEELTLFAKSDVYIGLNEGNFPKHLDENDQVGISMAAIGAVHEFGSRDGRIPARPWLRSAVDSQRKQISDAIGDVYSEIVKQVRTATVGLNRLGLLGVNIVRTYMLVTGPAIWLALSPVTVDAKGSDKPLVDTGQLVGSVTYVIKTGKTTIAKSKPISGKAAAAGAKRSKRTAFKGKRLRAGKRKKAARLIAKEKKSAKVVAKRAARKARKTALRARQKERKSTKLLAKRTRKVERRVAKKFRVKERKAAKLLAKRIRVKDRKVAKRTKAKDRRIALKFRKKDRTVLSKFRKKAKRKASNAAFSAKIKGKSNAKALRANRRTRQKKTSDNVKFRALIKRVTKLSKS